MGPHTYGGYTVFLRNQQSFMKITRILWYQFSVFQALVGLFVCFVIKKKKKIIELTLFWPLFTL